MLEVQSQGKRRSVMRSDLLVARAGECLGDVGLKHSVRIRVAWLHAIKRQVDPRIIDRLRQRYDDFAA